MPRTMYEITISRNMPGRHGVGKPRGIRKASTNCTGVQARGIYVSEPTNFSELRILPHLYRVPILLAYSHKSPSTRQSLIHEYYVYFYAYTSICQASQESVAASPRSIFDRRSTPFARASTLACLFLGLSNRTSQPNFKLLRELLISEKRSAEVSFSRRQFY